MIQVYPYNDVKNTILQLDLSKTIFWIGAGVSIDSPSCLPSGWALTEFYIKKCIGEAFYNYIIEKQNNMNEITAKTNEMLNDAYFQQEKLETYKIDIPRLEFIIDCIDLVDAELGFDRVIEGFQQFTNINSNCNHIMLNNILINSHSMMITANFDCCIEKCSSSVIKQTTKLGVPAIQVGSDYVYHYHGIGNDAETLGATIRQIKNKLPVLLTNKLKDLFSDGYNIIFLGFSCSDFFDVVPFFESMIPRQYSGKAIFFNHDSRKNVKLDLHKSFVDKIDRFLVGFSNKYIVSGQTSKFLRFLTNYAEETVETEKSSIVNWKLEFDKKIITPTAFLCYLIKILNQIGINFPDNNSCDKNLEKDLLQYILVFRTNKKNTHILDFINKHISINRITHHIENTYQNENKNRSIIADIETLYYRNGYKTHRSKQIIKQFRYSKKQNTAHYKKTSKIVYKEIMDWDLSKDEFCDEWIFLIYKSLKKNIILYYSCIYQNIAISNLKQIQKCITKLLLIPFNDMPYMSFFVDLMHYKWIINVLFTNKLPDASEVNKLLKLLTEINNFDYIAKHYRWILYIYLVRYTKTHEVKYIQIATGLNTNINKMVDIIDDQRERKKDFLTQVILNLLRLHIK